MTDCDFKTDYDFQSTEPDIHLAQVAALTTPMAQRTTGGVAKRLFDIVFSILGLLAFGPLMLTIALLLKLKAPGPVLFAHERVGEGGELFPCVKFRTMVVGADEQLNQYLEQNPDAAKEFKDTRKLTHDPRIIPVIGTILRKLSLDELPQFFNVLMGDMSVVGPRPVTAEEFDLHYRANHPYLCARPGITGLWQVSGRNDVSYDERVMLDASYVRGWTFAQDIAIIWKTIFVVCLKRNGK